MRKFLIFAVYNLLLFTLGKHIKYIGNNAFESSINLKELIRFEQIESIGKWAFKDCINLEMDITFKSIQYIGLRAFFNVNKIKSVSFDLNDDSLYQTLFIDKDAFSLPNALSSINICRFINNQPYTKKRLEP